MFLKIKEGTQKVHMILLVGGAYQGKEGAARRMAAERAQAAYGSRDPFSAAFKSDLVLELHEYIRRLCLERAAAD